MSIQSVIRFLLPREEHFYDFLERQAVVAHQGALAIVSFKDGDVVRVRDEVQGLEHEGDKIVPRNGKRRWQRRSSPRSIARICRSSRRSSTTSSISSTAPFAPARSTALTGRPNQWES